MTKRVKAEVPVEATALLPDAEGSTQLPGGETPTQPADEDRRIGRQDLSCVPPTGDQLLELRAHEVGEHHLLRRRVLAGPLEHAESNSAPGVTGLVEDVAKVEGQNLVLSQAGSEGHAVDDVVSEAVEPLPCDLQQQALLVLSQRARGAGDGVGVGRHVEPYTLRSREQASGGTR